MLKIGTTIRAFRLQKGLSQGDIEKKTGLLRCYLSRVENGHTVPSLDTLLFHQPQRERPQAAAGHGKKVCRHGDALSSHLGIHVNTLLEIAPYRGNWAR